MTERVYLSIYENLFIGYDIIGLFACQLLACSQGCAASNAAALCDALIEASSAVTIGCASFLGASLLDN
jgi:hypothetical protein